LREWSYFFQIPELQQSHVHVKDPERVAKLIKQMMDDAHHKLQVVADFDRTLSKYAHNGHVCSTTHGKKLQKTKKLKIIIVFLFLSIENNIIIFVSV
jgi:hypothetical protein